MKRLISVLLVLTIVLSLFSGFAGAEEVYVYRTRTGDKYHVAGCKYLKNSAIRLTLSEALARGLEPCSYCHPPKAVHTHSWGNGKVTTAATCGKTGVRTYTCSGCGQTKTESIPATGNHTWNSGKVKTAATCVQDGVYYYTCTVCGKTKTKPIPATGHSWNSGKVKTAATCVQDGVYYYTCTVCGKTKTEPIPATGNHTWNSGKVKTAATCVQDGVYYYTCTVCGKTKTKPIPATGIHTWDGGKQTTAATCKKTGIRTYTCTVCKTTKTETIPINPDAHTWQCSYVYTEPEGDQHGFGQFLCTSCLKVKEDEVCPSSAFVDVKNDWTHKGIDYAVTKGITNGIDSTHFKPDATCTRGQVVTFLWRAAGCPEPENTSTTFADMKKDAFYYKAVLWAVENGVANGIDKTHFGPDATCTRGQIVTFLWRFMGKPSSNTATNPFTDLKKDGFYLDAVLWAVENEITNGLDATHFGPDSTCTRAQVVTFLYRTVR